MLTEADIFHALVKICTECDETTRNEICDDLIPRLVDDVAEARDHDFFNISFNWLLLVADLTCRMEHALLMITPRLHPVMHTRPKPAMSWGELAEKYLKGRVA